MSVDYEPERRRYRVRWREAGRQRSRRFVTREDAAAFAATVGTSDASAAASAELPPVARGDGVYPYATKRGVRWRAVFRQADGSLSTRRGFTSQAAARAARRKLLEEVRRGETKPSRATFAEFWAALVLEKRPYMTAGSLEDFATHGRKRLLPLLGQLKLARIDEDVVRRWLAALALQVEAGEVSAKTINNARTCLSVACNAAVSRGLMPRNPCLGVRALPVERKELDYLRLHEIGPYLDACAAYYRPLAGLLIGSGLRISEALALRFGHLDLENGVIRVYGQRGRHGAETQATKGKRFRSVQVGPTLARSLAVMRRARKAGEDDWLFLCPRPARGRYSSRTERLPPSRKTVHDWHEAALEDAGLRDMPLHALRHTAAAAWLATGHPLIFVQRQLGHRSITTTEEHYGHLELPFLQDAVLRTEKGIASAAPPPPGYPRAPSDEK